MPSRSDQITIEAMVTSKRSLRTMIVAALLATTFCTRAGSAQDAPPKGDPLEQRFRAADRDGDGRLSPAEARQSSWFVDEVERFDSVDRDHSGTVTLAEIVQSIADQVNGWMNADSDHDGRVSESEAKAKQGFSDTFRRADADGDGVATRAELEGMSQRSYYRDAELPSVAPNIIEKRF